MNATAYPLPRAPRADPHRRRRLGAGPGPVIYRCADGYVTATVGGGNGGRMVKPSPRVDGGGGRAAGVDGGARLGDARRRRAAAWTPRRRRRGRAWSNGSPTLVAAFFSTRTKAELLRRRPEAGDPAGAREHHGRPARGRAAAGPGLLRRGRPRPARHRTTPGHWVKMSRTPLRDRRSGRPHVGEHTDEVLAEARAAPVRRPAPRRRRFGAGLPARRGRPTRSPG